MIDELPAALERIAELESKLQRYEWRAACVCHMKNKDPQPSREHRTYCRNYVGPLTHKMRLDRYNPTFGGWDHRCECGGYFRQGGLAGHDVPDDEVVCPYADKDWRGPRDV